MDSTNLEKREFLATYQQYKDFVLSSVWLDLQAEIKEWISDIHGHLGNEDVKKEIFRFQGRLQACNELLSLPDRILSAMEVVQEASMQQEDNSSTLHTISGAGDDYYTEQLSKWTEEDLENG